MPDELVLIGRVIKPHGIRGELAVDVLSDVDGRFAAGTDVTIGGREMRIVGSRPHQGRMLLRFAEVADRTQAESLRGRPVEAPPVTDADTGHYLVAELVGAPVIGPRGGVLGRVESVIELPDAAGYDLLEVRRQDGALWQLPAVDEYVEAVEDDAGVRLVLVDPPEGLVDDVDAEGPDTPSEPSR